MAEETTEGLDQATEAIGDEQSEDLSATSEGSDEIEATELGDEQADAEEESETEEVDFDQYVGGKPIDPNDPVAVSLQTDYTRKTQRLAEERKALAKERKLGEALAEIGLDPEQLTEQIRLYAANPQGFVPSQAQPQQPEPQADPLDTDPELVAAFGTYEQVAEEYGEDSVWAQMASRQFHTLRENKRERLEFQDRLMREENQRLAESRSTELSRLKDDTLFAPLLKDPTVRSAAVNLSQQTGLSVEQSLAALHYREQVKLARAQGYKAGFEKGRNGRKSAQDASIQTGRTAATVQQNQELVYQKKGGLMAMVEQAERNGTLKLDLP